MDRNDLLAAAAAADLAATAQTPEQERAAVYAILRHREALAIGAMYAQLNSWSATPHVRERLPLRDDGDDLGQVEARLPAELVFRLGLQPNFGWDGLHSDEGMRDLLKAHPCCRVKTISGKTTVGWRRPQPRRACHFERGTLDLRT